MADGIKQVDVACTIYIKDDTGDADTSETFTGSSKITKQMTIRKTGSGSGVRIGVL